MNAENTQPDTQITAPVSHPEPTQTPPNASPTNSTALVPHTGRPTGPRTDDGKSKSSLNALSHGLFSERPVVGAEREDEFQDYLAAVAGSLAPADPIETGLAERAACALWRLRRVTRYESETISLQLEQAEHDAIPDTPGGLPALRARLAERLRDLDSLRSFPQLDDATSLAARDALTIIFAVAAQTDVDASRLTIPGLATSVYIQDFDAWTAQTAHDLLAHIASLTTKEGDPPIGTDAAALLIRAIASAETAISLLRRDIDAAEHHAARLARTGCVPPPDAVDRIIRYEAHIAKQLTTALHELEAIQKRRAGIDAPLNRHDVNVTPKDEITERTP